jgi:hypothetical protein
MTRSEPSRPISSYRASARPYTGTLLGGFFRPKAEGTQRQAWLVSSDHAQGRELPVLGR